MFITTKLTIDMNTGTVLQRTGYEYEGPVALCKGDKTAKATEVLQQQNMTQQMGFNTQLMDIFKQQFGKENAITEYLNTKMKPMIDKGGEGYSPEALAAMRTSSTDTISTNYQNAQRALQANRFSQGSRDIPSGVDDQLNAALFQSEASDKSAAQNDITLRNENLKQQNYWNAINEMNGIGASSNPLGYAGAATGAANSAVGAGNSVASLSQAVTASQQSGLMGMLGGVAGGVFGAAGQAGGFGKLFCWIAAAIYGDGDMFAPEVCSIRRYLLEDFGKKCYGKPLVKLYQSTGHWVAQRPVLVNMLKPVFALALKKAKQKGY